MTVAGRSDDLHGATKAVPDAHPAFLPLVEHRPNAQLSDADVLHGCRSGDPDCWDELVERYERLVYSVALRNGLGTEDAADATQNTFLALMGSLDQVQSEDRLAFWLMTVARRQAWRINRRHARDAERSDSEVSDADDPIERWERDTVVHDAVQRLGSPCRELLAALYFDPDAPSYAIIAARLGRTIGGIGPLRGRCLERLRALLEQGADG